MRATFIGPPGAGKGTQAMMAAKTLGIPHLSTGDLLREEVQHASKLGLEAQGYMKAGKLVPDSLVLAVLRARLARPDAARGFILDGYPRNLDQAKELERMVALDRAIYFEVNIEELVTRLVERRTCATCHRVYNRKTQPPRVPDVCDDDGSALVHRPDDNREAVTTRFEVYQKETAPLLSYYQRQGILRTLPAMGSVKDIQVRVLSEMR